MRAAALALGLALLASCRGGAGEPDAPRVPRLSAPELQRGRELCGHYVERVCACAGTQPTLQSTCDLARGQPEALELHAKLLDGANGKLNARERDLTEADLRKVVAACVQADGQLDPATCPRR